MYITHIHGRGSGIRGDKGEPLAMASNLPYKDGDPVWTDGRIIYGWTGRRQPTHQWSYETLEAIPLNELYGDNKLYLYYETYGYEPYTNSKQFQAFANSKNYYCIDDMSRVLDMDIDSDGKPWIISCDAWDGLWNDAASNPIILFNRSRSMTYNDSVFSYAGGDTSSYTLQNREIKGSFFIDTDYTTNEKVIAHYADGHTEEADRTIYDKHTYSVNLGEWLETGSQLLIKHGDNVVASIDGEEYADELIDRWRNIASEYGATPSMMSNTMTQVFCNIPNARECRIDKNGNYSIVLSLKVGGYIFIPFTWQDNAFIETANYTRELIQPNPYVYIYTQDLQCTPSVYTTRGERARWLEVEMRLLVTNNDVEEIYSSVTMKISKDSEKPSTSSYAYHTNYFNGPRGYSNMGIYAGYNYHCTTRETYWGNTILGESMEEVVYPHSTQIQFLSSDFRENQHDYEMPVQDGYIWKNGDLAKVYLDDDLIVDGGSYVVSGIVKVSDKDNSYLILISQPNKTFRQCVLYKDDEIKEDELYQSGIRVTNTRLRWMKRVAALKKEPT